MIRILSSSQVTFTFSSGDILDIFLALKPKVLTSPIESVYRFGIIKTPFLVNSLFSVSSPLFVNSSASSTLSRINLLAALANFLSCSFVCSFSICACFSRSFSLSLAMSERKCSVGIRNSAFVKGCSRLRPACRLGVDFDID